MIRLNQPDSFRTLLQRLAWKLAYHIRKDWKEILLLGLCFAIVHEASYVITRPWRIAGEVMLGLSCMWWLFSLTDLRFKLPEEREDEIRADRTTS